MLCIEAVLGEQQTGVVQGPRSARRGPTVQERYGSPLLRYPRARLTITRLPRYI